MNLPEKTIEHYLSGTASAEEVKQVNDWFYSFDDQDVEVNAPAEALRERIAQRLQQTIHPKEKLVKPFTIIKKKWLAAAAVLLAITGGAAYFLLTVSPGKTPAAVAEKSIHTGTILPGDNKATLTLADGSTIVLDSAANGAISTQGNTRIVKLKSGQLSYTVNSGGDTPSGHNTIHTPRGGQYQVILPDGTAVWINSASTLTFPTSFTSDRREVSLQGEAYFEVAHVKMANGKRMPFTVQVNPGTPGEMNVNVLGTKFNIMAYEDEEMVKTTLTEGSVEASNAADRVTIRPGQQAGIKNKNAHFKVEDADIEQALAWKNGEFRFSDTNIKTIMRQLARWYDVSIEYRGDLSNVNLSGVVPRKEEIQQLLEVLETTGKVHFLVTGNKIVTIARQADLYKL